MTPRLRAIELRNQAVEFVRRDVQVAYRLVATSLEADPSFAEGWSFLGDTLSDLGSMEAACAAYRMALGFPDGSGLGDMVPSLRHRCLVQLGHRLIDHRILTMRRLAEAKVATEAALAMDDPSLKDQDRAFAHTNRSLIAAHEYDRAREIEEAKRGYLLDQSPPCELGLAFAQLFQGEYRHGIRHFEARFQGALPAYANLPWPRWDGRYVRSLLVLFDMGLGDTLSFARFIEAAASRVGRLVFQVQAELARLLSQAFRGVPNIEVIPQEHIMPDVDMWCPVFSLPTALNLSDAEIARSRWGIEAKPVENLSWKDRGARLHVAIAWAGMAGNGIDPHRSIRFEEFLALKAVPGIKLYSVQVGDRAKELHDAGGTALVRDMSPYIRDAMDTIGILSEMDLIVSCESFVAHLAGALNKRCNVLVSRLGRDWRTSPYLSDRSLWNQRTTVYRQGDDCDWAPVFQRVVEELCPKT